MSRRGRRGKPKGNHPNHGQQGQGGGRPHDGQRAREQQSIPAGQDNAARVIQADRPQIAKGLNQLTSVVTPRRQIMRKQMHQRNSAVAAKKYGIVFFETLQSAKSDLPKLRELASQFTQLNIVIRAEASMDDPELNGIGKVFAGAAWALIHERRKQDGWYDAPQE